MCALVHNILPSSENYWIQLQNISIFSDNNIIMMKYIRQMANKWLKTLKE